MNRIILLCALFFTLYSHSAFAARNSSANVRSGNSEYIFDNHKAMIGAGLIGHYFLANDDFRKGGDYGIPGEDDEIKYIYGINLNPEVLLNKIIPLKSKFGFSAGYRLEYMTGGYKYSYGSGSTLKREVSIFNHLLYGSISQPLDSEKYCIVGLLAGIGPSKYRMNVETSSETVGDYHKSVWGLVIPAGAFIDWGGDGIGARFGVELLLSMYEKESGIRPQSTGVRSYLNLRHTLL